MRAMLMALALLAIAALPSAAQQQKATGSSTGSPRSSAKASATPSAPVNINTASQAQIEALPGIGPKVAQRIIEYRQKNGQFKKVEDLMNVKGIGEKSFLKLKPYLTVSEKTDHPGTPQR
jgi:competence protein ComEA